MDSPCIGCKRRFLGCHGTCEKYNEFCRKMEDARKRRDADIDVDQCMIVGIMRNMRGKRR